MLFDADFCIFSQRPLIIYDITTYKMFLKFENILLFFEFRVKGKPVEGITNISTWEICGGTCVYSRIYCDINSTVNVFTYRRKCGIIYNSFYERKYYLLKQLISVADYKSNIFLDCVKDAIIESLQIFDKAYGEDRPESCGGYVLIPEDKNDITKLEEIFFEPIENVVPDFIDVIAPQYIRATYITGNDFSIVVFFRTDLFQKSLEL